MQAKYEESSKALVKSHCLSNSIITNVRSAVRRLINPAAPKIREDEYTTDVSLELKQRLDGVLDGSNLVCEFALRPSPSIPSLLLFATQLRWIAYNLKKKVPFYRFTAVSGHGEYSSSSLSRRLATLLQHERQR